MYMGLGIKTRRVTFLASQDKMVYLSVLPFFDVFFDWGSYFM